MDIYITFKDVFLETFECDDLLKKMMMMMMMMEVFSWCSCYTRNELTGTEVWWFRQTMLLFSLHYTFGIKVWYFKIAFNNSIMKYIHFTILNFTMFIFFQHLPRQEPAQLPLHPQNCCGHQAQYLLQNTNLLVFPVKLASSIHFCNINFSLLIKFIIIS